MTKNITTQELKANVGEVVDAVRLRGDHYVIQRRGKPVAALVPLSVNDAYEANRARFFELLDNMAERNKDLSEQEISSTIAKAVSETRRNNAQTALRRATGSKRIKR